MGLLQSFLCFVRVKSCSVSVSSSTTVFVVVRWRMGKVAARDGMERDKKQTTRQKKRFDLPHAIVAERNPTTRNAREGCTIQLTVTRGYVFWSTDY